MKLTHASVFSGIGGPEVAATMLGWDNLFHCEINPFGRAVLDYWYPNSKSYEDITTTDFSEWRGRVHVLTGGFPCQPFSYAGQRRGATDDRYLWPYMFRCIDQIQPDWVVAENVAGILTMVEQGEVSQVASSADLFDALNDIRGYRLRETFTLQRICDDLEGHGYAVQPVLIPACAVGAPHRRDRVFIIGRRRDGIVANTENERTGQQQPLGCQECGRPQVSELGERSGSEVTKRQDTKAAESAPADTEHLRLQHNAVGGKQAKNAKTQSRRRKDLLPEQIQCAPADGTGRNTTDTDRTGQSAPDWENRRAREAVDGKCQGEPFLRTERPCGSRWQGFPTVSPVHRGNDGLPFDVDDLTIPFSKWRTEALKAYGNAIVPQVMYEIFRAIEMTY